MLRHCDGTDPNLIGQGGGPCACGQTWDDTRQMVVWPHQPLLTDDQKHQAIQHLAKIFDVPPSWLEHTPQPIEDFGWPPGRHPVIDPGGGGSRT